MSTKQITFPQNSSSKASNISKSWLKHCAFLPCDRHISRRAQSNYLTTIALYILGSDWDNIPQIDIASIWRFNYISALDRLSNKLFLNIQSTTERSISAKDSCTSPDWRRAITRFNTSISRGPSSDVCFWLRTSDDVWFSWPDHAALHRCRFQGNLPKN